MKRDTKIIIWIIVIAIILAGIILFVKFFMQKGNPQLAQIFAAGCPKTGAACIKSPRGHHIACNDGVQTACVWGDTCKIKTNDDGTQVAHCGIESM